MPRSEIRYLRDPRVVEDGEPATVVARFQGLAQAYHGLLAYGPDAEVLAPVELRERIARAAAETAAIYAERRVIRVRQTAQRVELVERVEEEPHGDRLDRTASEGCGEARKVTRFLGVVHGLCETVLDRLLGVVA